MARRIIIPGHTGATIRINRLLDENDALKSKQRGLRWKVTHRDNIIKKLRDQWPK